MEEASEFQDWELLLGADSGVTVSVGISAPASGSEGDSEGVIKPDYCALGTQNLCPRRSSSSDGVGEGASLPELDDPSRVEPISVSGFLDEPSTEGLGAAAAAEFPRPDPGAFWTPDESSGVQEAPHDHVEVELDGSVSPQSEVVLEGVNSNGGEGEGEEAYLGSTGETDVVEAGSEESGGVDGGHGPQITVAPESPMGSDGESDSKVARGEKAGLVWWKLPMDLLKFCVFRIKPVWSISIAAALMGLIMLGRRLYKKKPKSRSIPLKITVDDKRVSQFMARATRLNEAFSVVKQVPVIRSTLPAAGVSPWPVMALR